MAQEDFTIPSPLAMNALFVSTLPYFAHFSISVWPQAVNQPSPPPSLHPITVPYFYIPSLLPIFASLFYGFWHPRPWHSGCALKSGGDLQILHHQPHPKQILSASPCTQCSATAWKGQARMSQTHMSKPTSPRTGGFRPCVLVGASIPATKVLAALMFQAVSRGDSRATWWTKGAFSLFRFTEGEGALGKVQFWWGIRLSIPRFKLCAMRNAILRYCLPRGKLQATPH